MTLRKIERDQRAAELSSVNAIIAGLTDDDFLTRIGLESRRDELAAWLAEQGDEPEETTASAALFFSGDPLAQTRGIQAEFGALAVNKFQDLVAKMLAQETGPLPPSGPVPNKGAATLHITNVTRGSFGFLLEEIEPQGQAIDTSLKTAVDNATRLLAALGETDEERFRAGVETVDQRALTAAQEFFSLMRSSRARFRFVAGEEERSFSDSTIALALERGSSTRVDTGDEHIKGQFGGALPAAHQFEFRTNSSRGTINGSVARAIPADELARWNREMTNQDAIALVKVRKVIRNGALVREGFTLLALTRSDDAAIGRAPLPALPSS